MPDYAGRNTSTQDRDKGGSPVALQHPKASREGHQSGASDAVFTSEQHRIPRSREDLAALRVVVRRGFTIDVADMLLRDLRAKVKHLEKLPQPMTDTVRGAGFHH